MSPQSSCWDGDWVAAGSRSQFPCPSLVVVGGTQPRGGFPQADFYAVFLHVPRTRPEAKSRQQLGSRPKRPPPARRGSAVRSAAKGPRVTSPWCVIAATFSFSFSGQGRGGVLERSPVQEGEELPGIFWGHRRERQEIQGEIATRTLAWEWGWRGTRPAQPVEQVDRSEPARGRRGRVCGGCTHAGTGRCHRGSPPPPPASRADTHSLSAFAVRICKARPGAAGDPETQSRALRGHRVSGHCTASRVGLPRGPVAFPVPPAWVRPPPSIPTPGSLLGAPTCPVPGVSGGRGRFPRWEGAREQRRRRPRARLRARGDLRRPKGQD